MTFSRLRVIAVALAAVVATSAGAAGVAVGEGATAGRVVVAQFASAAPLVERNQVKIDGVVVGEVQTLRVRDGVAEVVMALDPAALPLYRDARATIRPVSLLGERYVDLERGSTDAPVLPQGAVIPVSQTGTNVDLDEILNVMDTPTSEGLAFLVTALGEGVRGNGANADAAIRALEPALRDTQKLTAVLRDQNTLLNDVVDSVQPVATALAADDGRAMDALVGSADALLSAAAAEQEALDATLAELPAALESARRTLGGLEGAAAETTPVLREMRPFTGDLTAIAGELERFSDSLDPALASSEPVLRRAEALLDEAAPVAADLRAAGPGLRDAVGSARPVVEELTANLDDVFSFIRYWALATNGHDGLSHYLRVNAIVSQESVTGNLPAEPAPLPLAGEAPALPAPPALPEPPAELPGPPGLLEPPADGPGATGLTQEQERGMVGFLLGGGA